MSTLAGPPMDFGIVFEVCRVEFLSDHRAAWLFLGLRVLVGLPREPGNPE